MTNGTFLPTLVDDVDLFGYVLSPFTHIMGDYFYLMFLFITIGMMYLKSQDTTTPLVISILLVGAFGLMLPDEAGMIILALLGVGVGAILHRVFIKAE